MTNTEAEAAFEAWVETRRAGGDDTNYCLRMHSGFIAGYLSASTRDAERVKELERALEPFAVAAEDNEEPRWGDDEETWELPISMAVTVGDYRRAAVIFNKRAEPQETKRG